MGERQGDPWSLPTEIGCTLPSLIEGHIRLQVLAMYVPTQPGSTRLAETQADAFHTLVTDCRDHLTPINSSAQLSSLTTQSSRIGVIPAIENASGFAEETEPLSAALARLETRLSRLGRILYISLTHTAENRFGGGNHTDIGLKDDGRRLLDHLVGQGIAVDFAHTCDRLAFDILDHLDRHGLKLPVLASHSNFRAVCDHKRNLPDDLALEIGRRSGVIGFNFMRDFLGPDNPDALYEQIGYGLSLGLVDALCFGADYFDTTTLVDQNRAPFYHPGQGTAAGYPAIIARLRSHASENTPTSSVATAANTRIPTLTAVQLNKLVFENARRFITATWSTAGT
jgi:microsomal dipeptidase-like Zn-dependent dipeptidase